MKARKDRRNSRSGRLSVKRKQRKERTENQKQHKRRGVTKPVAPLLSVIQWMIVGHIFQISPNVTVDQQIYIVHGGIVDQSIQFACLVHIPGNFVFRLCAVDGKRTAIGISDLYAAGVHVELTG